MQTERDAARGRLTAEAYRYVRGAILSGEFPMGSVLAEGELARTLGSSRTPVRHALSLLLKEGLLGLLNGALVGITAGIGMFVFARMQDNPDALTLGAIVAIAMTASCVVSGVSGALIPMTLKRLGADPATASSIFLTTATDVASMGIFLTLATLLI